ncbi:3-deoxy-manno-octulosonate cytidylyltransferase [Candidatus Endobugula sertula]|uniref:3-deoxy-manno-octulosonate cytidylyltransferase n=1 Tax=Candidatus Endobugula sertula TaxID=62101 RepID=A0A1D2QRB8_9GAMM|nr:3-deoxy-manno-octulosonate cytidylyltransferase [Candidatus Endobugula sertula]
MSFTIVIPARFASSRLPGKPLLNIADKPMVQYVYEQALKSDAEKVIVATDDDRIVDAVRSFDGEVCMTSSGHVSGTDRIQEVAEQYRLDSEHIVVNVQGDEPLIPPKVINQVAYNLSCNTQAAAATLSEPIRQAADFNNPNVVKVVADRHQMALYFSRSGIPFPRDKNVEQLLEYVSPQRHIGVYAYRVSLLHRFVEWEATTLEQIEHLEQLRILSYGAKIHIEESCEPVPGGVDTPEDLVRLRAEVIS